MPGIRMLRYIEISICRFDVGTPCIVSHRIIKLNIEIFYIHRDMVSWLLNVTKNKKSAHL